MPACTCHTCIAQDLEHGFLLLSDLGNTTYLQALSADNARQLYGAATDALIKIQLASRENELPPYDEALLLREMRLFPDWYIAKHLQIALDDRQRSALETVFQRIVRNNLAQPRVYVHRDYHSRQPDVERAEPRHPGFPGRGIRPHHLRPCLAVQGCLHPLGRSRNSWTG